MAATNDLTSDAPPPRGRRLRYSLGALLVAILVVGLLLWLFVARRMLVTVDNLGPDRLSRVIVHVTGRAYPLGDLRSGEARTVLVSPTSESHVEVEFTTSDGTNARLSADCYFEPGYHGTIRVVIENARIKRVDQDISIGPL
jgi:hypothetical protein